MQAAGLNNLMALVGNQGMDPFCSPYEYVVVSMSVSVPVFATNSPEDKGAAG